MALQTLNPFRIHLGGPQPIILDQLDEDSTKASAAITPGFLVERHLDTTVKWRPNSSATDQVAMFVALDRPENNKGIDDAYAIGDAVKVGVIPMGCVIFGIIPSGQDISKCDFLQSNGDGKFKEATATTATANVAKFQSLDGPGAVNEDTRIRIERIQ